MLSVENLDVVYQDVILVLRGVSFEIPKGKIVSLLGSNGSGKTTVIRSITGLLDIQNGDITKGTISVDGEDITNEKPSKIVEKGIAQVLEGRRIFAELSVVENLRLGGHTNSKDIPQNIDRVLDLFPILKEKKDQILNPVWHVHNGKPPAEKIVMPFSMLLNLVGSSNADNKNILWKFINRFHQEIKPKDYPILDGLTTFAINYFKDKVEPNKKFKKPNVTLGF